MKKLMTLLVAAMVALTMLTPAMAEGSLSDLLDSLNGLMGNTGSNEELTEAQMEKIIYDMVIEELNDEKIKYDADDEYGVAYFSMNLANATALGEYADLQFYCYWDGVCINASYAMPIAAGSADEAVKLCNLLNTNIYIGKFAVDEYEDEQYVCYEVFLPMHAEYLNDYDRYSVMEYGYFTLDILEAYADYFSLVSGGESAANVFAMWVADTY